MHTHCRHWVWSNAPIKVLKGSKTQTKTDQRVGPVFQPLNHTLSFSLTPVCAPVSHQIDRMERFFMAKGLPHLMFYHQEVEPLERGTNK